MVSVDSIPVFAKRVAFLNLSSLWEKFKEKNWTTYGSFAFSSNYTPGAGDESAFVREVVEVLTGDPGSNMRSQLKRLHFEAFMAFSQDAQNGKLLREDDDKPVRLHVAERAARFNEVSDSLVG